MSQFTKLVKFETEFQGDIVYITMERLKRKDLLALAPLMPKPDTAGKVTMEVNLTQNLTLFEKVGEILPDYIKEFNGLKDADGNKLKFDDIVQETYFGDLLSVIYAKLFEVSFIKQEEEKN